MSQAANDSPTIEEQTAHYKRNKPSLNAAIQELAAVVSPLIDGFEALKNQNNIAELVKAYRYLREANGYLDQIVKMLNELEETLSSKTIPDKMESLNLENFKSEGFTYSVNARTHANIPLDRRDAGYKWLADNGLSAIITENVNPKTLSSAITNYIKEHGLKPPEDAVTVFQKKYISIRKA